MIKINLLPVGLRRKDDTVKTASLGPGLKFPVYPVMAVVFTVVIAVHIILGLFSFEKKMQVGSLDKSSKNAQSQYQEIEDLKKETTVKKDKVRIMESVLKKDFYLTYFMNKINKAVPRGLWLNRLEFSSKGLVMEGSVFSFDIDEISLVNVFFDELKKDNLFLENLSEFNIDSVQRRNIKDYEVLDFILTAKINNKESDKKVSNEPSHKRKR